MGYLMVSAQIDMTDRISDPDFEQEGASLWKTNSFGRQGNDAFPLKHGNYYREVWSGGTAMDAYIYQDLANLPVGTYTLTMTCQNVKQSNMNQVCKGTWIYANDQKTDFNVPGDYSVSCVVKDGALRIGAEIKNCIPTSGGWGSVPTASATSSRTTTRAEATTTATGTACTSATRATATTCSRYVHASSCRPFTRMVCPP